MRSSEWKPSPVNPNPKILVNDKAGNVDIHFSGIAPDGGIYGQFMRFTVDEAKRMAECLDMFTPEEVVQLVEKLKVLQPKFRTIEDGYAGLKEKD